MIKEKEKSLKIGLENHKLVRGFVNKMTNYCHSYLKKQKKKNKMTRDVENVLIFRKYKKIVYKDKQHDVSPEQRPRMYY